MNRKKILTIQDISCFGQCSLTVALPIISACGIETAILPSSVLSTHTGGFTGYTFRDLSDDFDSVIEHWEKENIRFDCLYTGYLGSEKLLNLVSKCRQKLLCGSGVVIVDPVMADNGKFYSGFTSEYAANMAEFCKNADIVLPNITECCFMTGCEVRLDNHTEQYIDKLLDAFSEYSRGLIVLKGIRFDDGRIGVAVRDVKTSSTEYCFQEREKKDYHGTGDCFASVFTGAYMHGISALKSAEIAAWFVAESIRKTMNNEEHFYGVEFERVIPDLVSKIKQECKNAY